MSLEPFVFVQIQKYLEFWRPFCLEALKKKILKKPQLEKITKYLFLTFNGSKINDQIGKFAELAWNHHRKKFNLSEKKFTLTRIRKAAQSKFEAEVLNSGTSLFRKMFNTGIGHQ